MLETLKNIIRMARRFKLATALNFAGLVISFIALYLLMTQIIFQVTYNHGLDDYERLYRMETDYAFNDWEFSNSTCRPFAEALNSLPQVESHSLVLDVMTGNNIDYYTESFIKGNDTTDYVVTYGNNTVVSSLTSRVLDGSIEWTDSDNTGLIIPASIARKYFGTHQASGKKMIMLNQTVNQYDSILVRGVYEDFPKNSEPWNYIYSNLKDFELYSLNFAYQCVIKFKEVPTDLDVFADSIKAISIRQLCAGLDSVSTPDLTDMITSIKGTRIKLTPLRNSYFEYTSFNSGDRGFKGLLNTLVLANILVIIMSTINFLNFTLAESPMRVRGVNTRMVLGAKRSALRASMVGECVVTALIACLIALAMCHLISMLLVAREFAEGSIALKDHWGLVALMSLIAIVAGVVAGLYPAIFATSFPPAIALKGTFGLTPQGRRLRTVLVCLQFFIAMQLTSYVGILFFQSRYILYTSDRYYGYDKSRIMVTKLPIKSRSDSLIMLRNELERVPGIKSVSYSDVIIGSTDGHSSVRTMAHKHNIRFCQMHTDTSYLRTMGIRIVEGRDFMQKDSIVTIINKASRKKWHWLKIGTKISVGFDEEVRDSATLIGVCEDIRYGTTRIGNDQPFFFIMDKTKLNSTLNVLNARLEKKADYNAVRQQANKLIKHYCGEKAAELEFYNKTLEEAYQKEFRFSQVFYYLCIICLAIMLIGVFCMTLFDTEYRRKEIGIRKVSGASTPEIIMMFCRHYAWLLLISFVAAVPVAWLCGKMTLNYFAEHISIHWFWWIFPLSLLLVGCVTLATVVLQCWRVARENPTDSIKNE